MTLHLSPPLSSELVDTLALWRARYPKFAGALDRGEPPLKALRYLGLALWQDGALQEAVDVIGAAAEISPEPAILADLGGVLSIAGRKAEALQAFTASLEKDPSRAQVWLSVAGLCNEIGDKTSAEHALLAALDLEPQSAEACAGLGLLYLERRRYEDAARLLGEAVARGVTSGAVQACLGQSLYLLGRFDAARATLGEAVRSFPGEVAIVRKFAAATLAAGVIEASVDDALDAYRIAAGPHAEDDLTACRAAFQALCGFGPAEAALRLGEAILAMAPGDPIVPYHLDALRGEVHRRASRDYVTACFDRYAEDFDRHIVEMLDYRLPERLAPLLAAAGRRYPRILDLGCGTGLAAATLATFGDEITGVDLSPRMLDKARERNVYARLTEDDAVAFLEAPHAPFDLIVALDMVIYLGDLDALFAGVAKSLAPGGGFVFSFETGAGRDYALAPTGRFAHDPAYVESLWREAFDCIVSQQTAIRLEANRPVDGRLVLLRRK